MSAEHAHFGVADGPLRCVVRRVIDYAMPELPGGVHQGLASPWLTLVISMAGPVAVDMPDENGRVRHTEFDALVGGLCPAAVQLPMSGAQKGIQIDISPPALRQLFGLPAAEIACTTVDLAELLGSAAPRLVDQLCADPSPRSRVELVTDVLNLRLSQEPKSSIRPEVTHAWSLLVGQRGRIPISQVASEIGWSRRHLAQQFAREFGLGPKEIARIARFDGAVAMVREGSRTGLVREGSRIGLVRDGSRIGLAEVAARAGYADQAHLSAESKTFAGCSPTEWIRRELPFLQDNRAVSEAV